MLDSASSIMTGADAYFVDGCPNLTVSSLTDLNHLFYIPNRKKPKKSMWILCNSCQQKR